MGGSVELCDVRVRRGGREILRLNELVIGEGEFVGLIGANGAGKTTALKVMGGMIRVGKGRRSVEGRIGYVPQQAEINGMVPFTLGEVVMMGRQGVRGVWGRSDESDGVVVDEWLERLGLLERKGQLFRTLSGGQQQKGLIARALAGRPELLLMDEAGANLDVHWKEQLGAIVGEIYEQCGVTVVMISHEMGVLPGCCGRLVVLDEGRVVLDGEREDVLAAMAVGRESGRGM